MIGSKVTRAKRERWSSQNAVAGLTLSSKVTRRVWFPASMNALPVFQSTPMDGSPAPCSPAVVEPVDGCMQLGGCCVPVQSSGAGYLMKVGAPGAAGGGIGAVGLGAIINVTAT